MYISTDFGELEQDKREIMDFSLTLDSILKKNFVEYQQKCYDCIFHFFDPPPNRFVDNFS